MPCFHEDHDGEFDEDAERCVSFFEKAQAAAAVVVKAADAQKKHVFAAAKVRHCVHESQNQFRMLIGHLAECKWDELKTEERLQTLVSGCLLDLQDYKMKVRMPYMYLS